MLRQAVQFMNEVLVVRVIFYLVEVLRLGLFELDDRHLLQAFLCLVPFDRGEEGVFLEFVDADTLVGLGGDERADHALGLVGDRMDGFGRLIITR